MKKYIISAIFGACLAFGFTACDVLDVEPTDSLTDDAVWSDLALAETYLNNCYTKIEAENVSNVRFASMTDEVHQRHQYWTDHVIDGVLGPDYPYFALGYDRKYNMWNDNYSYIKDVNYFMEHIDEVPATTSVEEAKKAQLKGQGYFLRAYFYHMLYSLFGRVVLVKQTHELDAEFNETRAEMDEVADYIIEQCDLAAQNLPVEYDDANFGRATKGAALALKGRVQLYKASPLFGTPSQAKWQAAANTLKQVIDMGVYHLQPVSNSDDYANLFLDAYNPEVIFEKLFDTQYKVDYSFVYLAQSPCGIGSGFNGWSVMTPTAEIVDRFQNADGTDYVPWTGTTTKNPWENREIRLKADILCDGDIWGYGPDRREVEFFVSDPGERANGTAVPPGKDSRDGDYGWNCSLTGYSMRKFMDINYDTNGTNGPDAPWFLIRLAEVYLNYAECMIELGNHAEALKYINMTRERALLPPAKGVDIRKEYEQERLIELAFESNRWFDLRRWKKTEEVYSHPRYGIDIVKFADGHKEYTRTEDPIYVLHWGGESNYWVPVPRSVNQASPQIDLWPYE